MNHVISYLKFLWASTNQHGVHSPFIYSLVTQCLYDKTKHPQYRSLNKKQQLIFRLINYFQPKTSYEISEVSILKQFNLEPVTLINHQKIDFIYFQKPCLEEFNKMLLTRTNDTVWVIANIYKTKKNRQNWLAIQQHKTVTVTVDTFQLGIVFFRTEQAKEHFTIRI